MTTVYLCLLVTWLLGLDNRAMVTNPVTVAPVSNKDFAKSLGIDPSQGWRIRNDRRLPSTITLIRICDVYGLDRDEAHAAYKASYEDGSNAFAAWLNDHVPAPAAESAGKPSESPDNESMI